VLENEKTVDQWARGDVKWTKFSVVFVDPEYQPHILGANVSRDRGQMIDSGDCFQCRHSLFPISVAIVRRSTRFGH